MRHKYQDVLGIVLCVVVVFGFGAFVWGAGKLLYAGLGGDVLLVLAGVVLTLWLYWAEVRLDKFRERVTKLEGEVDWLQGQVKTLWKGHEYTPSFLGGRRDS